MLFSHSKKFLFIQNPKTASTSAEFILEPHSKKLNRRMIEKVKDCPSDWKPEPRPKHGGLYTAEVVLGEDLVNEFFVFSVVRNPIDYLLSWFFFRKRAEIADPSHRAYKNYLGDMSLDNYLDEIEQGKRRRPDSLTRRLRTPASEELVDKRVVLCRYETLERDLAQCCEKIELPFNGLPRKNVSDTRKGFSERDLSDEQRMRILEIYRDEAEYLGYL